MSEKSTSYLVTAAARFLFPYKKQIIWASIALIVTAGLNLSLVQYVRIIVDQGFVAASAIMLNQAIIGFLVIALLQAIGTFARFYWVSWLGERVTADLRKAVFSHIIGLHPAYFEANLSGEIQSRITTDTTLIQSVIGSSASIALRNLLLLLGGIVFLFITNPRLTSVVLICIPLVIGPIMFFGRKVRRLSRNSQDEIANVGAYVGESIQQIKTVQAYTHEADDRNRFAEHVEKAFNVALQRIKTNSILITAVMSLVFVAIGALIWVGGRDVINGLMSAGELTAFVIYAVMVAMAVAAISGVIAELQRAAGALERLMELLHAENEIEAPENPRSFNGKPSGALALEKLTFAYPSRRQTLAIDDVSLAIEPGENVALVGPSGAGKSTLFELLQRFHDPSAGSLSYGGVALTDIPLDDWRAKTALVPQAPILFTGDVAYNIGYGTEDASQADIEAAAKAAYADEFIRQLPDGYQSELGAQGVQLSGGQRQRIALA
ncbi:MAG TPA: ABC transporter ATP-binding protein, partial [Gammaproteobacteria bacterium]|nr:ABC transporter ATP-binding protein [Gammaproteobacteria bacterium]